MTDKLQKFINPNQYSLHITEAALTQLNVFKVTGSNRFLVSYLTDRSTMVSPLFLKAEKTIHNLFTNTVTTFYIKGFKLYILQSTFESLKGLDFILDYNLEIQKFELKSK